jgi:photosystem II stability/assembly factor-like uncharacterized protein
MAGAAWRWGGGAGALAVGLLTWAPAAVFGQQIPDNPQRRWEFFYQKRAFPFDRIPAGALERARVQLAAFRVGLRGAPARVWETPWSPIGPEGIPIYIRSIGRLSAIAVHPTSPNTIYIGGAQGGVWKTTDGGASWVPLTDRECSLAMGALAIDPVNPEIVYAGTGEQHFSGDSYYGCGVLRSTNGGATWTRLGAAIFQTTTGGARISRLLLDPRGAGTPATTRVFVASDFGLYRSLDGGATLTRVLSGIVTDLVMDPGNPDVLYAALRQSGIFKSVNGGATWSARNAGFGTSVRRINLAIAPSAPAVLYASAEVNTGALAGIWRTANGADTWTQLAATGASCGSQCWYDQVIAVAPDDQNTVYFGGVSLYKSTNGGGSFATIAGGIHVDQHFIAFHPTEPWTVFVGNDGGIFRSSDGGASWSSLNTNLVLTQFYEGISLHPTDPAVALSGTQDNGTLLYGGAPTWSHVLGGDGGYTAIDQQSPVTRYAETQWSAGSGFSGPRRSDGGSFVLKVNGISTGEGALFIPPLVMHPLSSGTLYFGTTRVYRTVDRAELWTPISPAFGGVVSAIAPAAADPRVIYVGTNAGAVWTTGDGGGQWIGRSIPTSGARFVQSIAVDPRDPLTAYVVVSGFLTPHVFRTTDGGATLQDVSGNLPDVPVNAVVVDPTSRANAFIGTDVGAFASSDSGGSWTPLTDGIPNVAVFDLAYNSSTGVMAAGTHGRGMFTMQVDRPLTVALVPGVRRDSVVAGTTNPRGDSAVVVLGGRESRAAPWSATHGSASWIALITAAGTGSGMVRWTRNPTGLPPGTHVDTITVMVPGAVDSPWRLFDSLVVEGASMTLSPTSRRDSAAVGSTSLIPDSATVSVVGPGADGVTWTATDGAGQWLTLTTATGTANSRVRWARDPSGLGEGVYVDTIRVVTNLGTSAELVDSLLLVRPLSVTPPSRQATAVSASPTVLTDEAHIQLRGLGQTTATWTVTHGGGSWLTITTAAGTGNGTARWRRSADTVRAGTYVDTLVVATSRGDTARVIDTFTVTAPEVSTSCAAQHLLGAPCLDDTQRRFLDLEGNRDGTFNLGDFLAWLARSGGAVTSERRR